MGTIVVNPILLMGRPRHRKKNTLLKATWLMSYRQPTSNRQTHFVVIVVFVPVAGREGKGEGKVGFPEHLYHP